MCKDWAGLKCKFSGKKGWKKTEGKEKIVGKFKAGEIRISKKETRPNG